MGPELVLVHPWLPEQQHPGLYESRSGREAISHLTLYLFYPAIGRVWMCHGSVSTLADIQDDLRVAGRSYARNSWLPKGLQVQLGREDSQRKGKLAVILHKGGYGAAVLKQLNNARFPQ